MGEYKIFVGDYVKEGTPAALTLCGTSTKEMLSQKVIQLLPMIKHGLDIFIENPDKKITAYYRDNMKM